MFDLPIAKRVRRDDLLGRASTSRSPSPEPTTDPDAQRRLAELLNLDSLFASTESAPEQPQPQTQDNDDDEEQEFEFRLFSAPTKPAATTETTSKKESDSKEADDGQTEAPQKLRIRLRSPTPVPGEGGLVRSFRGWEHYFSTPALLAADRGVNNAVEDPRVTARKSQFADVAVSGEEMMQWAKVDWPGCHTPWRVIRWKRHQTKLPREEADDGRIICAVENPVKVPMSQKKPGKKRRVLLRKRLVASEKAREAAKEAAEKAKENEAEKRNRKNRERKIKRRQKAREQKAAAAGQDAPPADMDVDDVSSQEGDN